MRKTILWTFILVLAPAILPAQEETYPGYSITFTTDRQSGTAVFEGRTFDDLWTATIKALESDRYKIMASEKVTGRISATRQDPWGQSHNLLGTEEHWDVFLKAEEGKVRLTLVAENMASPPKAIRSICKKIAKQLEKAK